MKNKLNLFPALLLIVLTSWISTHWILLFAKDSGSQPSSSPKTEILYLMKYFYEDKRDPQKATAKIITEGETIGFFVKFEWGDYGHFYIKDLKGNDDVYYISDVLNTDDFYAKFIQSDKYSGKKVKVIWHRVDIYIPEVGGNQEIVVMVDLKML